MRGSRRVGSERGAGREPSVERYDRTAGQRASLRAHVTELGRTTVRMEGRGSLDALQGMGSDLKGIWNELNSGHEDDTNEETNKRSGEET